MSRSTVLRRISVVLLALCLPVALLFGLGALDIIASLIDNRVGIITSRAIRAVQETPAGAVTLSPHLAKSYLTITWSAEHADDDSLSSVLVTGVGQPEHGPQVSMQWCVFFRASLAPSPGIRVTEVAPANRAAWASSPSFAASFKELSDGPWACSAVLRYFKQAPEAKERAGPNNALQRTRYARR